MDNKLIGSILLIIGTCVGAGMLGLPIAAAQLGFVGSIILLVLSWFVMMAGALLILEVNLWLPQNNNIITMAKKTIGPIGQIFAWIIYLLLLYSLLCAYISAGSDLFRHLLMKYSVTIPIWISSILFTLIFGTVVYHGIRSVDYVNRGLMLIKFGSLFLLIILLLPLISSQHLAQGNLHYLTSASALMVSMSAFGYSTIIPSLRIYFAGDIKKLKQAIIIGSTIPLFCYILWDIVIMGIIPMKGDHSLATILHSANSTSSLVSTLDILVANKSIEIFIKLFTSVCVLTSFLGVALCLTDFFADGLQLEKKGLGNILIILLTFLPALMIVLYFPNIFIRALAYAGLYSIVLLILLPACMAWYGRYYRGIANGFTVFGGKPFLLFLIIFSIVLIVKGIAV